jgi:hypothetical protein
MHRDWTDKTWGRDFELTSYPQAAGQTTQMRVLGADLDVRAEDFLTLSPPVRGGLTTYWRVESAERTGDMLTATVMLLP